MMKSVPAISGASPGRPSTQRIRPSVTYFFGLGQGLICKVTMSLPKRARDAINLGAASIDVLVRIVEQGVFREDLLDGGAPAHWIVFTEHVCEIALQQRRYAIGHGLSPFWLRAGLRAER
jgi:hypothetical protein